MKTSQVRFGCTKELFDFSGVREGVGIRVKKKGYFKKLLPYTLIHFPNNLENLVFLKKCDFDGKEKRFWVPRRNTMHNHMQITSKVIFDPKRRNVLVLTKSLNLDMFTPVHQDQSSD